MHVSAVCEPPVPPVANRANTTASLTNEGQRCGLVSNTKFELMKEKVFVSNATNGMVFGPIHIYKNGLIKVKVC